VRCSSQIGLMEFRDYLDYVESEATGLYKRGLTVMEAARAIDLSA
jgi:hypothetical protein